MAEVAILWSTRTCTDLEEIVRHISQDSPAATRNLATKIVEAIDVLATFPAAGRIVPEYQDTQLREILYRNYRIVYQLSQESVTILTVFRGSRLLR